MGKGGLWARARQRPRVKWARKVRGGHSAIAYVTAGNAPVGPLKLYTLEGTEADPLLAKIVAGEDPEEDIDLLGLFTYDYFQLLKVLTKQDGSWGPDPQVKAGEWLDIKYPLAFIVFGQTDIETEDQ